MKKIGDGSMMGKARDRNSERLYLSGKEKVSDIEVSTGVFQRYLAGAQPIPIDQVHWKSFTSGLIEKQGSD